MRRAAPASLDFPSAHHSIKGPLEARLNLRIIQAYLGHASPPTTAIYTQLTKPSEDLIIYKVWYYSLSFQTKHVRDVISIILALKSQLDYDYIDFWVKRKNLNECWSEILSRTTE